MDKSSDAFRTISEVAGDLDLPQHVLRFWETRFAQIKPLKRGGGRRYYRPDDVDLLKGIRHLLYGEGYTIKGVQRILKDQGVRFVMTLWQEGAPSLETLQRATQLDARVDYREDGDGHDDHDHGLHRDDDIAFVSAEEPIDLPAAPLRLGWRGEDPGHHSPATTTPSAHQPAQSPLDRAREVAYGASRTVSLVPVANRSQAEPDISAESMAERFAPRFPDTNRSPDTGMPLPQRTRGEPASRDPAPVEPGLHSRQPPFAPMIDRFRGATTKRTSDVMPRETATARSLGLPSDDARSGQGLSRDEVRRLQATLFELLECKRLLDQAR